ncbi:hypothetical protein ACHAWF_016194 [Thalassiosira exigua]
MIRGACSLQTWSGLAVPRPASRSGVGYSATRSLSTRRSNIVMMPEGPEVRTLVDQLQPAVGMRLVDFRFLSGRYVRHERPRGFEDFAKTMTPYSKKNLEGSDVRTDGDAIEQTIDDIDIVTEWSCKGKFIFIVLDRGNGGHEADYQRSIWITLGMTGQFANEEDVSNPKPVASSSDRARSGPRWYMQLMDTQTKQSRKVYYRDARNFGTLRFCLSAAELDDKLASLGPDLLDFDNTTEEDFLSAMDKSTQNRNVCKFLMDQSKFAGVGNYILAEGLYRSRLDPFADLSEISIGQRRRLFKELREIAYESYQAQGLTRPDGGTYRGLDGSRGEFEFQLQCYGQRLSPNKFPVVKEVNGPHGRTIWYVEEEQLFMPRSQRYQYSDAKASEEATPPEQSETHNDNGPTYIFSDIPNQLTDASWKRVLSDHMASDSFQTLLKRVQSDANAGATIYPPVNEIFSAFNLCPLDNVKCVIVGQDPYHQPGQGHGLAFSVRKGVKPPPSLVNIFKEAVNDLGIDPPSNGNLEAWAEQGVLLLNAVLSVRRGEANSHAKLGWEEFTDEVINTINEQKDGVVFLLWGGPAQKKARCVDESKHTVIRTSHPSPLGATKTATPFLSSRCFSRANEAVVASGKDPIDWNVV